MKFGTYTFPCDDLPMNERLTRIRDVGYDFVGIGWYPDTDEIVNHCAKIGLPIENIHLKCNGTSKIWLSDDSGEAIVDFYCEQIRVCSSLGLKVGIAHPTWGKMIEPPNPRGLARYERIVECAEKHNFVLAVENTKSREHMMAIMDHFDSPYVKFCWDVGHQIGYDPDGPFVEKYGEKLCALHIHDTKADSDLHIAPLDGAGDWKKVAKALASTTYGREKLLAEPGGRIHSKKEGLTAAEIRERYKTLAAVDNDEILRFYDGYYTCFENMDFDEIAAYYLKKMRELAAMIEAEAK